RRGTKINFKDNWRAGWAPRRYSLAEEGTEIRIGNGNSDVGMIHDVERFRSKLDGLTLRDYESPVQGAIHDCVTGSRQNIAASVAEGIRRRSRERIHVEELIDAALTGRQIDAYARNNVGAVGCA